MIKNELNQISNNGNQIKEEDNFPFILDVPYRELNPVRGSQLLTPLPRESSKHSQNFTFVLPCDFNTISEQREFNETNVSRAPRTSCSTSRMVRGLTEMKVEERENNVQDPNMPPTSISSRNSASFKASKGKRVYLRKKLTYLRQKPLLKTRRDTPDPKSIGMLFPSELYLPKL